MTLDKKFKSILWEYDLSELNLEDSIVVERVLNLADENLTNFWIKKIGKQKAKKLFIQNARLLDKKSLNYWGIIFGVNIKKINSNKTMYEKLNKPIFSRSFG